ncbi:MAG TPA: hypothetical protein VEZ90_02740 [Blastocatellia bacterium]|nr:hypothetical protein [Blastocatellia bacterium]
MSPIIAEVILSDIKSENFFNNLGEVSQGANGRQRRSVAWSEEAASGGEEQCVFYGEERDSALIKLSCEQAVLAVSAAGCAGCGAVRTENATNILVTVAAGVFGGMLGVVVVRASIIAGGLIESRCCPALSSRLISWTF